MRDFDAKQVGTKLIVGVPYTINEVEFSIYRFLASSTKNTKKWSHPIEL